MNKLLSLFLTLGLLVFSTCDEESTTVAPIPETEPSSLSNGLIFHTPLSGNADDVSGTGLTGSVSGAVPTTDRHGAMNEAFRFDGENDLINFGPAASLALGGAQPYTMTAWVKPEDLSDSSAVFVASKFNGGVLAGWYLGINQDRMARAYRNVEPWTTIGDSPLPSGEYVHLAATFDGNNLAIHVNGVQQNSVAFRTHPSDQQTDLLLGALHNRSVPTGFFEGVIDDFRIYNRVLNGEELTWLAGH